MLITKIGNKKLSDLNHQYGSATHHNMDTTLQNYGFNLTSKSPRKIQKYSFLNDSLPRFVDKQEINDKNVIDPDLSLPYLNQPLISDKRSARLNYTYESPLISTRSSKREKSSLDKRTLFHLNLNNSTLIYNSNQNIQFPIKPAEALFHYSSQLSDFEKVEIFNYDEIYFLGLEASKISGLNLKDYDDENGYYRKMFQDQICYRYEIFETLGKGSFGIVIRCYDHKLNEFIALKIIKNNKRLIQQGLVEIRILKYLKSLDYQNKYNIVHYKEFFYFRSHLCITFELLGINLYQLIKRNNYQGFSIDLIKRFAKSLLQSLNILSKQNIIHCDLKPENILLKEKGSSQIKLIDFGSGCFQSERIYTYIQSRFYRAPEVILGIPYTTAIDIWSFGCILVELFTGHPLFPGDNEEELLSVIMEVIDLPPIHLLQQGTRTKLFFDSRGRAKNVSKKISRKRRPASRSFGEILRTSDNNFIDFIVQCLQWDPLLRLTPSQALIHPWIIQHKLNRNSKTINEDSSRENKEETVNIPLEQLI